MRPLPSLAVVVALGFCCLALAAPSEPRRAHLYRPQLPRAKPETPPERIVSLAPVLTEALFALGAGAQVKGVTRYCDRPPEAATLPKVGGFVDPQLEALLALEPDLVVAMPSLGQRQVLDRLRERGVPVLVAFGDSITEVRDLLQTLSSVVGRPARGAELIATLDAGLARVTSINADVSNRPRAVVVFQVQPIVVAGPGTFPDEALALAGATPATPRNAPSWPTWSLESLLSAAPDVVVAAEGPEAAERLRARLAVIGRRGAPMTVVSSDRPILMRPGPALHEDVAVLAELLRSARALPARSP